MWYKDRLACDRRPWRNIFNVFSAQSLFQARKLCLFLWWFLSPLPHLHFLMLCPSAFVFFFTNSLLFFPFFPEAFSVFVLKMTSFLPLQAAPLGPRGGVFDSLVCNYGPLSVSHLKPHGHSMLFLVNTLFKICYISSMFTACVSCLIFWTQTKNVGFSQKVGHTGISI